MQGVPQQVMGTPGKLLSVDLNLFELVCFMEMNVAFGPTLGVGQMEEERPIVMIGGTVTFMEKK